MKQPTRHERVVLFSVAVAETLVVSDDLTLFAETRDPEVRGRLAVRHLPLVKFVARRLSNSLPAHIDLDDLVSWGSLGLLDAIEKFEPSRGHKFSTYAVTRIRGAILDGLQQMDWAPKQVTSRVRNYRRIREVMTNELGYIPSDEQIAERIGVQLADVRAWRVDDYALRIKPLDTPTGFGGVADGQVDTDWEHSLSGEISELRERVAQAVAGLSSREAAVLSLYYVHGMTLRSIAEKLGVSVSSATQSHTHLVESIRHRLAAMGANVA